MATCGLCSSGPCPPRLVPLDSCPQPSPAWGAAKAAGLRWAAVAPSSEPTLCCREILRGLELSRLYGLFSSSTGLLLPCQQRLGPAVSPLPRTLWILFALSLGRQAGWAWCLENSSLQPPPRPTASCYGLPPPTISSAKPLSTPPAWVWVKEVSRCMERRQAPKSKDSGSNPSSAFPRCISWPELPEQSTTNWVHDAFLEDVSVQISPLL